MFKKHLTFLVLSLTFLIACQNQKPTEENENEHQNVEETSPSTDDEEDTTTPSENEEDSADTEKEVEQEEYASEEEAANAVERYQEIEETNVDLGYGVEALQDAGAGHQYTTWNEGRWYFEIDFPLDPENAVEEYEDGEELAKIIVEYLEEHRLPAPHEIGTISIHSAKEEPETIIVWQDGKTVYQIEKEGAEPLEAIQIAVDYESQKE